MQSSGVIMKKFLIQVFILLFSFTLFSDIRSFEKVYVDWWVVPLFASNKDNSSVKDLKKEDIKLYMNNKLISDFIIYKKSFNSEDERSIKIAEKRVPERDKVIVLLFDTVFSNLENLEKCKSISRDIIKKSDKSSKFVILEVNLFSGLKYIYGPGNDKSKIIDILNKRVNLTSYGKSIENIITIVNSSQISGLGPRARPKYTASENAFHKEEIGTSLKNTSRTFFFSFETLYFALNQINDNKFIYFFSEGISYFARKIVRHSDEEFSSLMQKSASLLGRSSSVIFIINPATTTEDYEAIGYGTGEDILKSLARESGGEYMEGAKESIKSKITNLNSSYYEIAFPNIPELKKRIRTILIKPVRKGLKINTIKSLEKSKKYMEMNKLEKEVLVLNLLKRHTFINTPLKVEGLEVKLLNKEKNKKKEKIILPKDFIGKYLDVYKILESDKNGIKIVKNIMYASKRKNTVEVVSGKDAEEKIVIVSGDLNIALVQGIFNSNKRMKTMLVNKSERFKKEIKKMTTLQQKELSVILAGTSKYCKNLRSSIFHFICTEDIVEKRKEFRKLREKKTNKYNYNTGVMISKREPGKVNRADVFWNTSSRYIFDYQLIQDKNGIKEKRKLIKGKIKRGDDFLKSETFVSKKIVMTPLAIFSDDKQNDYLFRFIGKKHINGIESAVVEVFPKKFLISGSIYGKVWIDLSNYSILRIEVNPVSIGGFRKILELSESFGSIVDLRATMEFRKEWRGLRFPTSVQIVERHYGGWLLNRILNRKFFQRTKTKYKYKDYRFFNVDTEVKVEKN